MTQSRPWKSSKPVERALILMKVAKVKHLFYPKKLMSAVGDNTSRRKGNQLDWNWMSKILSKLKVFESSSDRQLFDSQARNDNTSRIRNSVYHFFVTWLAMISQMPPLWQAKCKAWKTLKSILTGKTYVVRNSSFEGTGQTIASYGPIWRPSGVRACQTSRKTK